MFREIFLAMAVSERNVIAPKQLPALIELHCGCCECTSVSPQNCMFEDGGIFVVKVNRGGYVQRYYRYKAFENSAYFLTIETIMNPTITSPYSYLIFSLDTNKSIILLLTHRRDKSA